MANKLMAVARGRACATFTTRRRCEWDIAAGALILQEAGGRITSLHGESRLLNQATPYVTGVLASNGQMHDELLAIIAEGAEYSGQ